MPERRQSISHRTHRPIDRYSLARRDAADQHDQFIELIAAGDAQGAAALAVDHWELSRVQIEQFVTPDSLQMPLGAPPRGA